MCQPPPPPPPQGGVHRSLANFVRDHLDNEADPSPAIYKVRVARKPKDPLSPLAAHVYQKLEEGDFQGAVKIASSDDKVAPFYEATVSELQKKHTSAHQDTVIPSLNPTLFPSIATVSATEIIIAIKSFPCGSAGGPDDLSPQHLKDMTHPSANAGTQSLY